MPDDLSLISESILVIPLAHPDLVLKAADLSGKVRYHLLQNFEVALTCLMILDLIAVGVNYAVTDIV